MPCTYCTQGLAGYLAYPMSVTSNIINNLTGDDPWVEVRNRGAIYATKKGMNINADVRL